MCFTQWQEGWIVLTAVAACILNFSLHKQEGELGVQNPGPPDFQSQASYNIPTM